MKKLFLGAVSAVALLGGAAQAADMKFALIPKGMDNPYFDLSRDGCMAEAKKLGVTCIYKGPATHEPATEVQITQDFVTQGVDGIAISVADADSVIGAALIEVIRNGLALFGADTYWEQVFVGTIIILAVLVDRIRTREPE